MLSLRLVRPATTLQMRSCWYCTSATPKRAVIAAKHPFKEDLQANKFYAWCACGHSHKQGCKKLQRVVDSAKYITGTSFHTISSFYWRCYLKKATSIINDPQDLVLTIAATIGQEPFCDGSHRSIPSAPTPLRFRLQEGKTVFLCGCKQTRGPPYCDGTHKEDWLQRAALGTVPSVE